VRLALIRRLGGRAQAERAINRVAGAFKPVTIAGLLATLVIVFVFQGALIGSKALHILLIAVPMTLSTVLVWCTVYLVGSGLLSMPHVLLAPAALIATSNFFELAIAVAVGAFGAGSGAALATSVGVLVEVPVMLALVAASNALRARADARAAAADWGRFSWARKLFVPPGMVVVGLAAAGAEGGGQGAGAKEESV
jgi:ACR3 family arsenite transporter